jgi:type III pantothenate kinase
MLLVLDVGNTNIGIGLFDGTRLVTQFRVQSARSRTTDEYVVFVRSTLAMREVDHRAVRAAIIASVVPTLTETMAEMVRRAFAREPLVVGPGIRTGMPILYENPREVGADRIVNAVAAYEQVGGAVVVVDFGTATTFDCVSPKGEYLGGAITPGIQISADALFSRAAKLSGVEIAAPPRVVGRNPAHSMQSGIVFGYAALVDGMVARIRRELGYPCAVIATGGLAPLIARHTETIERVDDNLTLEGLRLVHERNACG